MRYKDKNADLPSQFPKNFRKGLVIALAAVLLLALTFVTITVKKLKGSEFQQTIEIEEIEQTRQKIKKEEPKPRIAEVIEAEDEDVPDTVTIAETELDISDTFVPPPPPDEEPVAFWALESPPTAKKRVDPKYPELARKGQVEGAVMVEVIIGFDGKVERATVVDAEPKGYFEDAALAAARNWEFTPAMQRDKPVKVRYQIPFKFRLK